MNIGVLLAVLAVTYFVIGNMLWTHWMSTDREGLSNPIVRASLMGTTSAPEAVAFWIIKGIALAIWPIGAAVMYLMRASNRGFSQPLSPIQTHLRH